MRVALSQDGLTTARSYQWFMLVVCAYLRKVENLVWGNLKLVWRVKIQRVAKLTIKGVIPLGLGS